MALQLFIIFALSLLLGIASAIDVFRGMEFGYSGHNGPDKWGKLNPTFSPCSTGKRQSPINIQRNLTVHNKLLKPLTRNYESANATLVNRGYSVGVSFKVRFEESPGDLWINDKNYTLQQFHWHLPAEHHIEGQRFAAELHMVHRAADNSAVVVSMLYHESKADPLFSMIMEGLKHLGKENTEVPLGTLNINELNRRPRKYYTYVMSISKEQITTLDSPLNSHCKKNARPCQPLNGREVDMYDELN
ncbi:alpha carbonic anhydrase 1, chloroplastic isoform X3 [Gossypium raimondii]|uniref:alpha carbonic anhydrase 1, chloroplastic isoform X3 n=1 Tax=Gossypium raimondii TaxID=29730 RepID=UPI00227BF11E|nr:alpha carbonic anhydrase 1, chloroplastic isoform X3 [Gossypium raimondii]